MKFTALLKAQFQLERRGGEQVVLGLSFAVILGALTFLTLASAYLDQFTVFKLVPALYWILFLFAATISVGRVFEADIEFRAVDALRLALRGQEILYFFAKFIFVLGLVMLIGLTLLASLYLFSPARISTEIIQHFFIVLLLVAPSYSALSTIISALLSQQRLRMILLPCLLFPLLTPVLFGAVELSFALIANEASLTQTSWFWVLVLTAICYPLLGSLLFPACLEE